MEYCQIWLKLLFLNHPQLTTIEPRIFFHNLFRRGLGCEIDPDKFCFVPHHYAHGGNGCSSEYPVERYLRDSKIMEIIEGSTQIQEVTIAESGYQDYIFATMTTGLDKKLAERT